jgi:hypothetical protein
MNESDNLTLAFGFLIQFLIFFLMCVIHLESLFLQPVQKSYFYNWYEGKRMLKNKNNG